MFIISCHRFAANCEIIRISSTFTTIPPLFKILIILEPSHTTEITSLHKVSSNASGSAKSHEFFTLSRPFSLVGSNTAKLAATGILRNLRVLTSCSEHNTISRSGSHRAFGIFVLRRDVSTASHAASNRLPSAEMKTISIYRHQYAEILVCGGTSGSFSSSVMALGGV